MIIGISGKIGSGKDTVGKIIQILCNKNDKWFKENLKKALLEWNGNFDNLSQWQIKKFADKLKDIVCLLIGCTREQLEDSDFKNKKLEPMWWYWYMEREGGYSPVRLDYLSTSEETLKMYEGLKLVKPTPRLFLQQLGTDCGRDIIHPNIWINSLMSEYKFNNYYPKVRVVSEKETKGDRPVLNQYPNWIITDTRFPNELEAIKKNGGITIRVTRTGIHTPKVEDLHPSETALDNSNFDYYVDNSGTIEELIEKVKQILIKEKII